MVLTLNAAFKRSCAAWLAEFKPLPPRLILPGLALSGFDEISKRFDRALLWHDQEIWRVVKPKNGRDVSSFVLYLAFQRLKYDVRQIHTDDV